MSELEHYLEDFAAIDREIMRAALVAGIDLNDEAALRRLLDRPAQHPDTPQARAREKLRGLLFLREKLETEEIWDVSRGMRVPK